MVPKSRALEKHALALDFLIKLDASSKIQEDVKHFISCNMCQDKS